MEINYPHSQFPIYIDGKDKLEDLKSMLFTGGGINEASSLLHLLMIENTELIKHIFSSINNILNEYKRKAEEPLVPCTCCVTPNKYLCITKDKKLVISSLFKRSEENKFVWDRKDVLLYFPHINLNSVEDLLYREMHRNKNII